MLTVPLDHCRIGSLENANDHATRNDKDHCRIGSLEIELSIAYINIGDHCRIGSLENVICDQKMEIL